MVCAELTSLTTIAVPGCSNWGMAIATLRDLGCRRVRLALDMDRLTNPYVAAAMSAAHSGMEDAGFEVGIEEWSPEFKGLDDFLLAALLA